MYLVCVMGVGGQMIGCTQKMDKEGVTEGGRMGLGKQGGRQGLWEQMWIALGERN